MTPEEMVGMLNFLFPLLTINHNSFLRWRKYRTTKTRRYIYARN